ncbi:MAG TPA: LysR family transcriptional regulator [Burkholderiaceae bacterium]|jgi:DNA-binding transcriptional LysR family regulator
MNIKQIETFVRIIELGGFGAAAEALHASQSTVSARIKDLERHLGVELFDRSFHRAQLTQKGHELYDHARQLVEFTQSLTRQIRDPNAMTGLVQLGVVGVVANTWLPGLVSGLRQRFPQVTLRIDASLTRLLLERLRDGKLDLAIVAGEVSDADLHSEPLGQDRFVWMASPALGVPQDTLSPSDIARWPVLSFTEDSHHYPVVKNWFRDGGAPFRVATACNDMDVLAALTMRGLGVSLLPRHCYRSALAEGQLVELATTPAIAPVAFSLVHRKDRVPALAPAIAAAAKAASDLPRGIR